MAKRWKLKWIVGAVAVLVAAGAVSAWAWYRPVTVTIAALERNVPIQVFGLGTIEAQTISRIGFESAGTLVELHVDHGDSVKAGALLARLQSREQEARVIQAQAAVAQARAGVEQAEAAVEKAEVAQKQKSAANRRRQELVERGAVSRETADDTQAAADVAKADVGQARSAVSVARANVEQASAVLVLEEARLAKHSLFAPYDAVVMTRHRELGSALNANEAVFTLVDPDSIWALAYIDEARAGPIEIGQPAEVVRRSAPDRLMQATVVRIEIESDRVNEERRVYVRCGGCPLAFHLGEQAEIVITMAILPSARMVKRSALVDVRGRKAVAWTVEDGLLHQRPVTLGHRTLDGRIEIRDGVPEGAEIVSEPATALRTGRRAVAVVAGAGEAPR